MDYSEIYVKTRDLIEKNVFHLNSRREVLPLPYQFQPKSYYLLIFFQNYLLKFKIQKI